MSQKYCFKSLFRKLSELSGWYFLMYGLNFWWHVKMILINSNDFVVTCFLTHTVWTGVQFLYLSRKKWGDIPRYAHILLYFWPETYTQKEEIRKHDLISYFVYLYFKIPSFVTNKLPRILAIHFPSIIYLFLFFIASYIAPAR